MELDKKYSDMAVLLFAARHGVKLKPDTYGVGIRRLTIETIGSKYSVGNVYTLERRRKCWKLVHVESVPKAQYESAEAERELTHAMHCVYTGLMRYNEYLKNQKVN